MGRSQEVAAGAGLGTLVGVLIGLSSTPVVGGVISGLVALLVVFFGLSTDKSDAAKLLRIASFGTLCTLGTVLGVTARAHAWLSPSTAVQVKRWTDAGFPPDRARALVAYSTLGILPSGISVVEAPRSTSSALFSAPASSECNNLLTSRFRSRNDQLDAMRQTGGSWKELADSLQPVDEHARSAILDAAYGLACP